MPRKPKLEKTAITVVVNGTPVTVTLHPPTGTRRSWYVYWTAWWPAEAPARASSKTPSS